MATRAKAAALDKLAGKLMLVAAIVFSIAFATILLAHIFERYGGYAPCPLCLQERYAYYFGVPARSPRSSPRAPSRSARRASCCC